MRAIRCRSPGSAAVSASAIVSHANTFLALNCIIAAGIESPVAFRFSQCAAMDEPAGIGAPWGPGMRLKPRPASILAQA